MSGTSDNHKALVGLAALVIIIVLVVVAALALGAGTIGTTQDEVDKRMTQCIGYIDKGAEAYLIQRGCLDDARIYERVDCEMYDMPACNKVDEFFRKYLTWQRSR